MPSPMYVQVPASVPVLMQDQMVTDLKSTRYYHYYLVFCVVFGRFCNEDCQNSGSQIVSSRVCWLQPLLGWGFC